MPEVYYQHELIPGAVLGHYTIVEHVAEGGMGHVYKGFEPSLQREVAIKVLKKDYASDPEQLEQFESEAQSIASLRHPNIVPIYYVGAQGEINYFVMPYITGHTLDDWIDEERVMTLAEADWAIRQAIDALDKAFRQNVVHLDIKPSNFLLDEDGTLLLTDFGLARTLGQNLPESENAFGTPAYMAPEQIKREAADQRSDIYSLGASLFHLMTGELLYDAETITGIVKGHVYNPFPIERAEQFGLVPGWIHLMEKMTRKEPGDRYQDYEELRDAVNNINRLEPIRSGTDHEAAAEIVVTPRTNEGRETYYGLLSSQCSAWLEGAMDYGIRRSRDEIIQVVQGKGIKPLEINQLVRPLRDMISAGEPEMEEMCEVIESLPHVEAYIIALADSPLFNSTGEPIATRRKAVRMVGLEFCQKIAFSAVMIGQAGHLNQEFNWRPYWTYAVSVGVIGRLLLDLVDGSYQLGAGRVAEKPKRGFHTNLMRRPLIKAYEYVDEAGLIHALGKLVLGEAAPYTYFVALRKAMEEKIPLAVAEEAVVSLTHHEAGELWLQTHLVDSNLKGVCEYYCDYESGHGLIPSTVLLASHIARVFGMGYGGDPVLPNIDLWQTPSWAALSRYSKDVELDPAQLEGEFLTALSSLPLIEL